MVQKRYPYRYLDAYTADDADLYFGRANEIRSLAEQVGARSAQSAHRHTVLLGPPGAGKSSLLQALRDADLVHPTAERGEVQAFLERHISASEAKEFCLVMRSFAPDKPGERRRPAARASKASTGRGKSAPT